MSSKKNRVLGSCLVLSVSLLLGACMQMQLRPSRDSQATSSLEKSNPTLYAPLRSASTVVSLPDSSQDPSSSAALPEDLTQERALSMSDEEIFSHLIRGGIGACYVFRARPSCPACFCELYLKSKLVPWSGAGWPENPFTRNSTGCVSSHQFPGYTPRMATTDLIANVVEQTRDALAHPSNPCGLKARSARECPNTFLGRPLISKALVDSSTLKEGLLVCKYQGAVSDEECLKGKGTLQLSAKQEPLCRAYADAEKSILLSISRIVRDDVLTK